MHMIEANAEQSSAGGMIHSQSPATRQPRVDSEQVHSRGSWQALLCSRPLVGISSALERLQRLSTHGSNTLTSRQICPRAARSIL